MMRSVIPENTMYFYISLPIQSSVLPIWTRGANHCAESRGHPDDDEGISPEHLDLQRLCQQFLGPMSFH